MDMAPLPVQQAVESNATAAIVSGLGIRLGLHIDVIGKIAALNVQMLLGLVNPQGFLQELIVAGVPDKDAREIMTEINQKIFVPLREEMRRGTTAAPEPAKPATPPRPQSAAPFPLPRQVYEPPPQSPSYSHLESKFPPPPSYAPPRPIQPPRPLNAPRSGASGDRSAQQNGLAPRPMDRMLEDHEEPHIEFHNAQTPRPFVAPDVGGASPSRTAPPPVNLPGALPPSVAPVAPSPPKAYSTDPYREPIE